MIPILTTLLTGFLGTAFYAKWLGRDGAATGCTIAGMFILIIIVMI